MCVHPAQAECLAAFPNGKRCSPVHLSCDHWYVCLEHAGRNESTWHTAALVLTWKIQPVKGGGNDVCSLFNLLVFRVLSQEMEDVGALPSYTSKGLELAFPRCRRASRYGGCRLCCDGKWRGGTRGWIIKRELWNMNPDLGQLPSHRPTSGFPVHGRGRILGMQLFRQSSESEFAVWCRSHLNPFRI